MSCSFVSNRASKIIAFSERLYEVEFGLMQKFTCCVLRSVRENFVPDFVGDYAYACY